MSGTPAKVPAGSDAERDLILEAMIDLVIERGNDGISAEAATELAGVEPAAPVVVVGAAATPNSDAVDLGQTAEAVAAAPADGAVARSAGRTALVVAGRRVSLDGGKALVKRSLRAGIDFCEEFARLNGIPLPGGVNRSFLPRPR